MEYISILVVLFAAELIYFHIAQKWKIIDIPNGRSSHSEPTLRGGGIIYWVTALIYFVLNPSAQATWIFLGLTAIAAISFLDDVAEVRQKIRLIFQLLSITCAFIAINAFGNYSWWVILLGYFFFVGILNAYNFMDGINGMTGLCSLVILGSLQYVNLNITPFVDADLIWYPMIASVVFLFFNFRKQAKCFAGDVGSISIGFWVMVLLLRLTIQTQNLIWIGFLLVYGVETCGTIFHRILRRENITLPHRLHFFQILVNEYRLPHRLVSSVYAALQLICSALIIWLYPTMGWWIFGILAVVLSAVYTLKFKLMIMADSPQLKANMRKQAAMSYQPAYADSRYTQPTTADSVPASPETAEIDAATYIAPIAGPNEAAHDASLSPSGATHDATHSNSPASKPESTSAKPQPSTATPSAAAATSKPAAKNPALSHLDETEPAESVAHPHKDDIFLLTNPNHPGHPGFPDRSDSSRSANP
ncbi:MAG: hypothetical protein GX330_06465 [Bacteroidales bacterium]|nr:hypothetical protein [Bacteroidales bacterium]